MGVLASVVDDDGVATSPGMPPELVAAGAGVAIIGVEADGSTLGVNMGVAEISAPLCSLPPEAPTAAVPAAGVATGVATGLASARAPLLERLRMLLLTAGRGRRGMAERA